MRSLDNYNLPKLKYPHLKRALEKKVKEFISNQNVKGISIFGSIARGDYCADSDIELEVIDKSVKNPKAVLSQENGINFHIRFLPFIDFEKRKHVKWRIEPPFAKSWIIIDKTGELKKLRQFDLKISKGGPKPLKNDEKISINSHLSEILEDCKRFRNNSGTLFLILSDFIIHSLNFYYRLKRLWWPGLKKVMADIKIRNPNIAKLIEKIIKEKNSDKKIYLSEKLLKNILKKDR